MTNMSIRMLKTVVRDGFTLKEGSSQSGYECHDGIDVAIIDENGDGHGDHVRLFEWESSYEVMGN